MVVEGRCLQNNPQEINNLLPANQSCPTRPETVFVYANTTAPSSALGWPNTPITPKVIAGPAVSSPPLLLDVNNDGLPDIVGPTFTSSNSPVSPATVYFNEIPQQRAGLQASSFVSGTLALPSGVLDLTPTTFNATAPQLATGTFLMNTSLNAAWSGFALTAANPNTIACPDGPCNPDYRTCNVGPTSPDPVSYRDLVFVGSGPTWSFRAASQSLFSGSLIRNFETSCHYISNTNSYTFLGAETSGDEQPLETADIDADGIPDLVTTVAQVSLGSGGVVGARVPAIRMSSRNWATGTYSPFSGGMQYVNNNLLPNVGLNSSAVANNVYALADMTGDGLLDLITLANLGRSSPSELSIFPGNGDGTFDADATPPIPFNEPYMAGAIFADVNGDGLADAIVSTDVGPEPSGGTRGGGINVYFNYGGLQTTLSDGGPSTTPFSSPDVRTARNGDGAPAAAD